MTSQFPGTNKLNNAHGSPISDHVPRGQERIHFILKAGGLID